MEKRGRIIHPKDAKVAMEDQELVREYVRTDKITFGVSRLMPGAVGALDPGAHGRQMKFFTAPRAMCCATSRRTTLTMSWSREMPW